MSSPRIDTTIRLPDDRRLAYAEYGDPTGTPVFLFHGVPGSRLAWGLLPDGSLPPTARIVAPDRPGYGGSDPKPGRTLLGWADDVMALADALEIERFAIVGVSGGGPGALVCAWKLPERLTTVGIVCCPAPTEAPGVFEGMSKTNRFFMRLAPKLPWLSALNARFVASITRRNPARYIQTMKYKLHDVDLAIVARPGIFEMMAQDFAEALRRGGQGMVDDIAANHGRPWGFGLGEIRSTALSWSCDLDRSVPPAMGEYLRRTVPACEATFVPDAGHLWMLAHLDQVLDAVLPRLDS